MRELVMARINLYRSQANFKDYMLSQRFKGKLLVIDGKKNSEFGLDYNALSNEELLQVLNQIEHWYRPMIRWDNKLVPVPQSIDSLMIDPGEWRTLTSHQKQRIAILKPETTMADAIRIVDSFGNPHHDKGGKTNITSSIDPGEKVLLKVHAMWYREL